MRQPAAAKPKKPRRRQTEQNNVSPGDKAKAAAIKAKAARIEQRVRDHHAIGQLANKLQAKRNISTTVFAAKHGIDPGTLRRSKQFAELYSAKTGTGGSGMSELDEICNLRRPNGLPLHWGFLPYLMTVKGSRKRRQMAAKAAAQGWSPARLHAEIRQLEGRSKGHGRKVELPTTPVEGLLHILREGRLWLARSKKLIPTLCSPERLRAGPLDAGTKTTLDEVAKLFTDVVAECDRLGKTLKEVKRSPPKLEAAKRKRGQNRNARTRQRPTR